MSWWIDLVEIPRRQTLIPVGVGSDPDPPYFEAVNACWDRQWSGNGGCFLDLPVRFKISRILKNGSLYPARSPHVGAGMLLVTSPGTQWHHLEKTTI